jgi:hypothetical protein
MADSGVAAPEVRSASQKLAVIRTNPTLVSIIAAVASGIGVLGFVTFAGGAVLWSRFKGMGLPAEHVLGLLPRAELIATGAQFLVPAVLFTTLIGAILMFVELRSKTKGVRRVVVPFLIATGELAGACVALAETIPLPAFLILVLVGVVGATIVATSAESSSLPVLCLVIFLALGTFAIVREYEITANELTVIPMAYARDSGGETRIETGFFVAKTDDRIVFATKPSGARNELREFPRGEAEDLALGALERPSIAERSAAQFALSLCKRFQTLASSPHATPICPQQYLDELNMKRRGS